MLKNYLLSIIQSVGVQEPPPPVEEYYPSGFTLDSKKAITKYIDPFDWNARGRLINVSNSLWLYVYLQRVAHAAVLPSQLSVIFSDNQGQTWTDPNININGNPVVGLPNDGDGLIIGDLNVLKCPNGDIISINHMRLPAWNGYHIVRSSDSGLSWVDEGPVDFGVSDNSKIWACLDYEVVGNDIFIVMAEFDSNVFDPRNLIFKSSDNGNTWILQGVAGPFLDYTETGIVHMGNNKMMLVSRSASEDDTWLNFSSDLGQTWGSWINITSQVGVVQQPKLKIFSGEPNRIYLFGRKRYAETTQRNAFWWSDTEGYTWNEFILSSQNFSDTGYCDCIKRSDNKLYIVGYEGSDFVADTYDYILGPI